MWDYIVNLLSAICCGARHRTMKEIYELRKDVRRLKQQTALLCC